MQAITNRWDNKYISEKIYVKDIKCMAHTADIDLR